MYPKKTEKRFHNGLKAQNYIAQGNALGFFVCMWQCALLRAKVYSLVAVLIYFLKKPPPYP